LTLLELRVQRFRQHRAASFQFARGFNVVVGPNEAGKSALRDALRLALFGNPEAAGHRQEASPPWGSADPPVLELVFEVPEGRFELVKDFATRRVALRGQGRTWERPKLVQEAIYRALGFHSEKAFTATAHVRQAELHEIGERDVARQLGRIVAGADEDASRALQSLKQALESLERGLLRPASNPGRLARLRSRLAEAEQQVAALRRGWEEARALAAEAARLRRRLAEVEAELADRTRLVEFNRSLQQAQERAEWLRKEVSARQALLDQLGRLEEQLHRTRGELEQLPPGDQDLVDRVQAAVGKAEELEAHAARVEAHQAPLPPLLPSSRGWAWAAVAVAALFAAAWPGFAAPARAVLAAVAAAAAWAAWADWQAKERARRARAEAEAENRERRHLAQQMRGQAQELRDQVRRDLAAVGAGSLEDLRQRVARRQELEAELKSLQQRVGDLLAGRDREELQDELRKFSADLHAQLQFLGSEPARSKALLPLELQRLERELEELGQERAQLQGQLQRLEARLEAAPEEDHLLRAEEELAALRGELERLERRRRALRVALEVLGEAKAAVEVPARQAVEEKTGQFLARLTGGRYTRVRVPQGADALRLEVWSEEAGGWLPPEEPHLSRGTVDLVFLAARVALVDVLASSLRPPLLLDDPFVTFDRPRRERALEWLRELSRQRQVLLFTWDEEVAQHADAVIRLAGPKEEADSPPRTWLQDFGGLA
jgi:uncharacterized protein YhaN